MRTEFLLLCLGLCAAGLLAWVWYPRTPAPAPTPLSIEEQKKRNAVVVFSIYLGFLALIELDARQRWNDRYRRCDPEPYAWYPLERMLQLLEHHLILIVHGCERFSYCILSLMFNFHEWPQIFTDDTIRDIASGVASPVLAAFQIAIDIATEIVYGTFVYVPFRKQPMCYVYCVDSVCEYI